MAHDRFMRRSLVADLPAAKMPRVHQLFRAQAIPLYDAHLQAEKERQRGAEPTEGGAKPLSPGGSEVEDGPLMAKKLARKFRSHDENELVVTKAKASTLLRKLGLILDELR